MYCKKCNRYINGFKARVKHQMEHYCDGFTHFFVVAYIEGNRPRPKFNRGRRIR